MNRVRPLRSSLARHWPLVPLAVLGVGGILFLGYQLFSQLTGIRAYWWWLFWETHGDSLDLWFAGSLALCLLLLWRRNLHTKRVPQEKRTDPNSLWSIGFIGSLALTVLLFLASSLLVGLDIIVPSDPSSAFTPAAFTQKASLASGGKIYRLILKTMPLPSAEVHNAYALDLYQCDATGWWCRVVHADIGSESLVFGGESMYVSPDQVLAQMTLDAAHSHLSICYASMDNSPPSSPHCISFPLPQRT